MRSLFKPVTANNSGISANIFAVISQAATPRWQGFCGKAFSARCFSSANNSDINEDCTGAVHDCHVTEAIGGLKGSSKRRADAIRLLPACAVPFDDEPPPHPDETAEDWPRLRWRIASALRLLSGLRLARGEGT